MHITNCRVNHIINPMGYLMDTPVFSWQVEEAQGKEQTAARIVICTKGHTVADTDWTNLDSLSTPIHVALNPCTRYEWTVAVRTDAGEEVTSGNNWFETGKMNDPWQAKWIGCDDADKRHPLFYKEDISARKELTCARLYICGLGLYEVLWNGEKIGNECLTPYCNNYDAWVQYQTYDVTDQLRTSGTLSVLLGNGWYKGRFGFEVKMEPYYGDSWKLIAELRLSYADGTMDIIGTDESWQVTRSTLTFSNIYDGEWRDDTLPGVSFVQAQLALPPKGKLTERMSIPVTVQQELLPSQLIHTPAGETVLDIGQNIVGSFRLQLNVPKRQEVHIQFGEILQEGNFYRDNMRTAQTEYRYVSSGMPIVLEPHFTFYGYRYVKIEGVDNLQKDDFTALVMHSELPRSGSIVTGHPLVNQLIRNVQWGQRGNFLDVPTDCPQRDERMGWTGDAEIFAPTACYQMDCSAFFGKFLFDIYTEQMEREGQVPAVVPSFGIANSSAAWGDAACIIPMVLYRHYGDKTMLMRQFPAMAMWIDYLTRVDGEDNGWRRYFHYGDWLALDGPTGMGAGGIRGVQGGTDVGMIASTYYLYSARLTAEAAGILGLEEEKKKYTSIAEKVLEGIQKEYFSPLGRCCVDTQTAHLLALRHCLTPNKRRAELTLVDKLRGNGGKLQTGFVGTPLLCEELTRIGRADMAYDLLLNEEYPGWLYEVNLGATTIWERWDSVLPDGSISDTGMNSLNHYAYGSIVEWIYARCAGLMPVAPGFRKVKIVPVPDQRIGHLTAEYRSAAGVWKSAWDMTKEGYMNISVTVPFGCEAQLVLPCIDAQTLLETSNPMLADVRDGVCHLKMGSYQISYHVKTLFGKPISTFSKLEELVAYPTVKQFLGEHIPGLDSIPEAVMSLSLRELGEKSHGYLSTEQLDRLDEALERLSGASE